MAIALVASAALSTTPGQAATPSINLLVCRAHVDTCQTKLSIPISGTISLNLILELKIETDATAVAVPLDTWKAHYVLSDRSLSGIKLNATSGQPVQEQHRPIWALDKTPRLDDSAGASGGYLTVQNRFDPVTGQLDYAITLTNFNLTGHPASMQLDESHPGAVIGRIVI